MVPTVLGDGRDDHGEGEGGIRRIEMEMNQRSIVNIFAGKHNDSSVIFRMTDNDSIYLPRYNLHVEIILAGTANVWP